MNYPCACCGPLSAGAQDEQDAERKSTVGTGSFRAYPYVQLPQN